MEAVSPGTLDNSCFEEFIANLRLDGVAMKGLFRRCVQCPNTTPACPTNCGADESCSFQIATCEKCASTSCVKNAAVNASPPPQSNTGSAAGPIAGGVVGGIVVIAVVTYLVWRFCIRKRRQEFDENEWHDDAMTNEKGMDQFSLQRDARASTHTVGSIASTVLTRASNIIQIAYIPGVTNRSIESSPELIPPVPPIPAASSHGSTTSSPHMPGHDQHFFMPSDLRGSTYSDYTDRSSMARSSVATTMYRNNAIVNPIPAQSAMRGKANTVSVKSKQGSPTDMSRSSTPPMPELAHPGKATFALNTKSSIIGRVGTPKTVTVTRNASNAHPPQHTYKLTGEERSEAPKIKAPERQIANASPQYSNDSSTFEDASSDEEADSSAHAKRSLIGGNRKSDATTVINDDSPISPTEDQPFQPSSVTADVRSGGPSSSKSVGGKHKHKKSSSLNQIIEEATRKATRAPRHGGLGSYEKSRGEGPFSDANAAGTP